MKIYVAVDLEGISGIINAEQVKTENGVNYDEGRKYMTEDINACVEGCFRGGATEVVVADKHGRGRNVLWHELDDRASYIVGHTENSPDGRLPEVEGSDGLILLGYHAMAGTCGAVLRHTWSSADWHNLWINGNLSGEIALDTYFAADSGVPTIMVSGDDKLCAEAKHLIPSIVCAQVKRGLTRYGAKLLSKGAAHKLITDKSEEAVNRRNEFKPLTLPSPVTLRLECVEQPMSFSAYDKPFAKIINERTFEVTGDNFWQAFYRLLNM